MLALKQFEQCYILARWIRHLFTDIINRQSRSNHESAYKPASIDERVAGEEKPFTTEGTFQEQSVTDMDGVHDFVPVTALPTDSYSMDDSARTPFHDTALYDMTAATPLMDNYVPGFFTNDFLPLRHDMEGMGMGLGDFPSPSSLEYQSMHFLADLGLSGFGDYQ